MPLTYHQNGGSRRRARRRAADREDRTFLIALSAAAMGMQTAGTRRLGVAGVTTTFVTGTLTSLIAELAGVSPDWRRWTLWAATLICIVIRAAAGVIVFFTWRPGASVVTGLLETIASVDG